MKGKLGWFGKHKILSGVLILVIIIIAAASGSKTPTKTNSTNTAATTSSTQSKASTASSSPSSQASTARKVTGTAVTLGAGTFTGGTDVAVGLYDVTPGAGQSGNFIVTGTDSYDEILGVGDDQGVPSVRTQISKGDSIQISGLSSVTFTPVTAAYVTTHNAATLGAGTWVVGQDIGAGRYVAAPASGQSGNFIVTGNDSYDECQGPQISDTFFYKLTAAS